MELLVVMTIIVILAAMLMPALQQAREKSRQAVCMGNLRQIGMNMTMFCGEHNDYFPPYFCSGTWGGGRYEMNGSSTWYSQIIKNVSENKPSILKCPSNPDHTSWHFPYSQYAYNLYLNRAEAAGGLELRLDTTVRPSSALVIVADAYGGVYFNKYNIPEGFENPANGADSIGDGRGIGYWHSNGANLLYADGHVEWRSDKEIQGAIRTTPNIGGVGTTTGQPWWNPWDPER